ncbi:MAG: DNA-binding protein [Proteobacteria bacterium]|nr:DNA-binding protein [Pseudomonadota bacterium]MBU4297130.1 DNA-binding protein [Pseudomonadota bacterium]MCG2746552.1 DNA-binding protein [Desulfobulbaceae bacterium]
MSNFSFISDTEWRCGCCNKELQPSKVNVEYMGSVFNVELMACPACGFVLVPEKLALGKMLEVEQLLEDK